MTHIERAEVYRAIAARVNDGVEDFEDTIISMWAHDHYLKYPYILADHDSLVLGLLFIAEFIESGEA